MKTVLTFLILFSAGIYSQWSQQTSGTIENLNEAIFQNENTGYVCGNSGVVLKTTNAGLNWTAQNTATSQNLTSISINYGNNNYVIAAGKTSTLLLSTNAGSSWSQIPVTPVDYFKVRHADIFNVYVCGTQGRVIYSSTAGATWTIVPVSGADTLFSLAVVDASTALTAGNGANVIYRTTNKGANWTPVPTGASNTRTIKDLFLVGSTCYALVSNGEILKSNNGGVSWFSYGVFLLGNIQAHRIFILGNDAYMSVSGSQGTYGIFKNYQRGSGIDWYQLQTNFPLTNVVSFMFTSTSTGYAVSGFGAVFKTTNSGGDPIGIEPVSNEVPSTYSLSQNYPNPFNPETNIEFSIPSQTFVKLAVYDILGKEVTVLVSQYVAAGKYKTGFDASKLNSGVYFYRLQTESYTDTKRMILTK